MKFFEWEADISKMTDEELKERWNALNTLSEWNTFNKEFDWTGYNTIKTIISYELHKRGLKQ